MIKVQAKAVVRVTRALGIDLRAPKEEYCPCLIYQLRKQEWMVTSPYDKIFCMLES